MPQTQRQKIIRELYNELSQHHVDSAAVQIEQVAGVREGVMREEQRALPVFFKSGGIYERLLDKHPEFKQDSTQAKQAEDAAVAELLGVIKTQLASSHDRLNGHVVVGAQAAQEAVTDPSKRYRREYEGPDKMMTFDDIGRLHSALRLIFNDATIDPASHWRTQYFNGDSGYQGHSYRHFLALIWKGATESDMVAPVNFTGMTSDELKGAAVEQIISALAQCRREHNYDKAHPDWVQDQAPKDAQRCDMGLRGDLFGQMLMFNEHYMQTRTQLNLELVEPLIRDFMVEEFGKLPPETKVNIISYLDDKALALGDPGPEEEKAQGDFVASIKQRACDVILQKIMDAGPQSPLSNIKTFLDNIKLKIQNRKPQIFGPAKASMVKIRELINAYVALEADSLSLEGENAANMDFLRRFAMLGIDEAYKEKVKKKFLRHTDMIKKAIDTHRDLDLSIRALQYRVENDVINATIFGSLPKDYQSSVSRIIDEYLSKLDTQTEQITHMIDSYANAPSDEVASKFLFASDQGVASHFARTKEDFIGQQRRILDDIEKMKETLKNMRALLHDPLSLNPKHVRVHLQPLLKKYIGDKRTTPDFQAEYLLTLLKEKTPTGNYLIEDANNNELKNVSFLINSLDRRPKSLLLFAFNSLTKPVPQNSPQKKAQIERLRKIFDTSLSVHGISLSDPAYTPTGKMTLEEVEYRASKITPSEWELIVAGSGKQAELNSFKEEFQSSVSCDSLIEAASYLPIIHSEIPNPHQPEFLSYWTAVVEAIFKQDPTGEALINFVAQTLIRNLEISEYSKEDHKIIGEIVKLYMGLAPYSCSDERGNNDIPQPLKYFEEIERQVSTESELPPESKTKLRCGALANHISVMLTTLSPPAVKSSFNHGIVRLMSRYEAKAQVGLRKYVFRLSNYDPSIIYVTTCHLDPKTFDLEVENNKLTSPEIFEITVGEKTYQVGKYPGEQLKISAGPFISDKVSLSDTELDTTTNVAHQSRQQEAYYNRALMYAPMTHNPETGLWQNANALQGVGIRDAVEAIRNRLNPKASAAAVTNSSDSSAAALLTSPTERPAVEEYQDTTFSPPTQAVGPAPSEPNDSDVAEDQPCNLWGTLKDVAKLILWAALLGGAIYLACTSSLILGIIGASFMLGVGIYSYTSSAPPRANI